MLRTSSRRSLPIRVGAQAGSQLATGGARELCLSLRAIWFELAELDGYALREMPSA